MYLLSGLRNTLIIAFFACIFGVSLGFVVAYIRTSHDKTGKFKIGNALCKLYLTIIRGTPSMVQLMLIYYVILVSMNNKILVAVIAFGINSGAYVAETFRAGIMSIDPGQMEAARSLGLSYTQATWKIILPQTFKNVLPALGNELIVLLKETSISGYIGISELTRGANIIISRTYSSALPLIAIALIYLGVVIVLQELVNRMEARLAQSDR
ncbi:MAG: amino acid ABC transporter permease [Faecalibacterium sp.]